MPHTQVEVTLTDTECAVPFRLLRLQGSEGVSRVYEYDLVLYSADPAVEFSALAGGMVTLTFRAGRDLQHVRHLSGRIQSFQCAGLRLDSASTLTEYHARIVPWTWFLSLRTNCRIFQNKSTPEILAEVLADHEMVELDQRIDAGAYAPREYCVQYNESDLNFIGRLLEEEGIYYWFDHGPGRNRMVLCDSKARQDLPPGAEPFSFSQATREGWDRQYVREWGVREEFRPGVYAHTSYNFKTPSANLAGVTADTKASRRKKHEVFVYKPGALDDADRSGRVARLRMEELHAGEVIARGASPCVGPAAGYLLELEGHALESQNGKHFLLSCATSFEADQASMADRNPFGSFSCQFDAIPAAQQFRPKPTCPKPIVHGPQVAVVTGPAGEEIHTDEHGRVRVSFFWDRYGNRKEDSSCWMRVSQPWAGKGMGGIIIPRVGQEVVVEFLDGDPDHPLVNGRLFNAESMPPNALPGDKAKMSIKTESYPGGGGSNEITLNDTKGKEMFYVHAQHDQQIDVGNNRVKSVGLNETTTIAVDRTESVGNNEAKKIAVNKSLEVGANSDEKVGGSKTIDVGESLHIKAGTDITIEVGSSKITMNKAGYIQITGMVINTTAGILLAGEAPVVNMLGLIAMATEGGVENAMLSGCNATVKALSKTSISGKKVQSVASAEHIVKGAKVSVSASGETSVMGTPVKLN